MGDTETPPGQDGVPRIGLCFSGGGFRATLYALGVVHYLADLGLLANVQAVSAVSGGSLAAAVLADRWPELAAAGFAPDAFIRLIQEPLRDMLDEHNVRNEAVRNWIYRRATMRGRTRGSATGEILVERLLTARRVVDLDPALQVIITSTDLATGRAFRVSRDFIGSYDFDYPPPPEDLSLGNALAASAAVPLLFPPVYLPTDGLGLRDAPAVLSLVDGGVYDNLGLEWFQGWSSGRPADARPVDFTVIIDASGPLGTLHGTVGGIRAINRSRDIQYYQTRAARLRWHMDGLLAGRGQGVYVAASSDPRRYRLPDGTPVDPALYAGALPSSLVTPLAALRTDLDRFTRAESALLTHHGYWCAHARLGALYPELAASGSARERRVADPDDAGDLGGGLEGLTPAEERALLRLLQYGAKRRVRR